MYVCMYVCMCGHTFENIFICIYKGHMRNAHILLKEQGNKEVMELEGCFLHSAVGSSDIPLT